MGASRKNNRKSKQLAQEHRRTRALMDSGPRFGTTVADTATLRPVTVMSGTRTQLTAYSGPFPSPEMLAEYEAACPGSSQLLMKLYGEQVRHRLMLENRVTKGDDIRAYLGWGSATFLTTLLILLGSGLIYAGHDWAGASIITTNLVALAGVFLYGAQSRRKEREAKAKVRDAQPRQSEGAKAEKVDVKVRHTPNNDPRAGEAGISSTEGTPSLGHAAIPPASNNSGEMVG